jgi:hypothetical protein
MAARLFPAVFEASMMRTGIAKAAFEFLLAAALLVSGCGRSGLATYPVSGKVTYNGAAVPDGSIVFMPLGDHTSADAGKISQGSFAFSAKPGKKRVEIRAVREVGEVIHEMGVKARQSYIPAKYNAETTLTAEVVPGEKNQFVFDLKGPP